MRVLGLPSTTPQNSDCYATRTTAVVGDPLQDFAPSKYVLPKCRRAPAARVHKNTLIRDIIHTWYLVTMRDKTARLRARLAAENMKTVMNGTSRNTHTYQFTSQFTLWGATEKINRVIVSVYCCIRTIVRNILRFSSVLSLVLFY